MSARDAPTAREIVTFCFFGGWRRSPADRFAVLAAWCLSLAIVAFNAFFALLFPDGNLLIRGVCTLILAAPLLYFYGRGKRALGAVTDFEKD